MHFDEWIAFLHHLTRESTFKDGLVFLAHPVYKHFSWLRQRSRQSSVVQQYKYTW